MKALLNSFLVLLSITSFSQTYVPDPTFGGTGIIKFGDNPFRPKKAMLVNNAYFFLSNPGNQLVKVNYNGEYVSNFGQWGTITFGQSNDLVTIEGFQYHGNYFYLYGSIVNTTTTNRDLYVVKLDENGNSDTNFGLNGFARIDLGQNESILDLNVENDGTLFCTGTKSTSALYSSRLIYFKINPGGTISTTFDANGYKEYQINAMTAGFKILNYNNKKLLVGLTVISQTNNNHPDLLLLSIDSNGMPDPLYGTNGCKIYGFGGGTYSASLRDVQLFNNKLYISYYRAESISSQGSRFVIYDLLADQGTTPSIPSNYLTFTVGSEGLFSTKWCARCCSQSSNCGGDKFNISKWNLNGAADLSFHNNGVFSYAVPTNPNPQLNDFGYCQSYVVIKEPSGKLLLGGYVYNPWNPSGFTLMRLVEQSALGTGEIGSAADGIYPNPFDDTINVTTDQPFKTVEIYDLTGRKIARPEHRFDNGKVAIDLSAISQTGTYILKAETGRGGIMVNRIIKK